MAVFRMLAIVFVSTIGPVGAYASADVTAADRAAVDRIVREQIGTGRSADGQPVAEYQDARRYAAGSGPDDGTNYVAVQYTIEIGNSWHLYLAVLDGSTHKVLSRGRVGGKGYRDASLDAVRGGVVVVTVKYYGLGDPLCCPSISGTSSFEVRSGELWEVDSRVAVKASQRQ